MLKEFDQQDTPRTWRKTCEIFPWDNYQCQVLDFAVNNQENLLIGAVAGSGKTTLLEGIVGRISPQLRIKILAFNKHIAERLKNKGRLPTGRVTVSTTHALGYYLCVQALECKDLTVSDGKILEIAKECFFELNNDFFSGKQKEKANRTEYLKFIKKSVEFCQRTLTEPTEENLIKLWEKFNISFGFVGENTASLYDKANEIAPYLIKATLLRTENRAINYKEITYNEMLYLPHIWEVKPAKQDLILVDEAQDLNNAQLSLIEKYHQQGTRLIFVGDERQAIMGFNGTNPECWKKIKSDFGVIEMPLSYSHRCSKKIIQLATLTNPEIKPAPNAPEGKVQVIDPDGIANLLKNQDLIICRFNAPLLKTCLLLLRNGYSAKIRGRDIGKQLAKFAKDYLIYPSDWPQEWEQNLKNSCSEEIQRYRDEGKEIEADNLADKFLCIIYCFNEFKNQCKNIDDFCREITNLFDDEKRESIILSTIHRAKGDEADRVFFLGANHLPYYTENQQPWQEQQEINLIYVGITRAKSELYLLITDHRGTLENAEIKREDFKISTISPEEVFKISFLKPNSEEEDI